MSDPLHQFYFQVRHLVGGLPVKEGYVGSNPTLGAILRIARRSWRHLIVNQEPMALLS